MGLSISQDIKNQNDIDALAFRSKQQLKIFQWRSNPQYNQFIPKVFFQYQSTQKKPALLDHCQFNQNLPLGIKYQKFIGNLTLLYAKLSFQESLFVLKSLLSGFQAIFNYFAKAIIEPTLCFITRNGEIKAWINEDYKKNLFANQELDTYRQHLDDKKLFLKPEKWIDTYKLCFSQSKIIQNILNLVAQLTYQQNEYKIFKQKVDAFIGNNILKNNNFDRIIKFLNKYVYQNRLIIKSNLVELIQKLYYQNQNSNQLSNQYMGSKISKQLSQQRHSQRMSTIIENKEIQNLQMFQLDMRKCVSSGSKQPINQFQFVKNSQFFNSTSHTNTNTQTNFNSRFHQNSFHHIKQNPIYNSYCSSNVQRYPFNDLKVQKHNLDKNHISPQFSLNYNTVTYKVSIPENKENSICSSSNSSFISSSKSSVKNKAVDFKLDNYNLNVISERKQTEPDQRGQICINKSDQYQQYKENIINRNSMNKEKTNFKSSLKKSSLIDSKMIEQNKKSNISLVFNIENISNRNSKSNLKMFKSNCAGNDQQNRRQNFYSVFKSQNQKDQKNSDKQSNSHFTIKTITKLITSNQNISNQQQSEGDFPSAQNVSSYSGVLASMGRSVQIIQIPDIQKQNARGNKKLKTMFVTNPSSFNKNYFNAI